LAALFAFLWAPHSPQVLNFQGTRKRGKKEFSSHRIQLMPNIVGTADTEKSKIAIYIWCGDHTSGWFLLLLRDMYNID